MGSEKIENEFIVLERKTWNLSYSEVGITNTVLSRVQKSNKKRWKRTYGGRVKCSLEVQVEESLRKGRNDSVIRGGN